MDWKKGRGKLGMFRPLLGITWRVETDSELGLVVCTRRFTQVLGEKYVQLEARWEFGEGKTYDDLTLFGVNAGRVVSFWSFQSDGKNAYGEWADVTDIHPLAWGFEAEMPAGRARQAFFPAEGEGWMWVVEAKPKKNWSRVVEHHYLPED